VLVDHLIYAAPDLPAAVAAVEERFGVRPQSGGKHIGAGTHNALLALGPRTYLEILAPDPEQPARPVTRRLQGLTHGRLAGWRSPATTSTGRLPGPAGMAMTPAR
jgi:hypothetical protein